MMRIKTKTKARGGEPKRQYKMEYLLSRSGISIKSGQTLVEVVAAVGVVMLLVTGLVVGATATLKANQYSRAKSLSVRYAEEAIEIVRNERNKSWADFFSTFSDKTLCLAKDGTWTGGMSGCSPNIDGIYTRIVTFIWHPDPDPKNEKMSVDVRVSWQDGTRTYQSDLSTYFTQWK